MTKLLALVGAMLCTLLSLSSAGLAASGDRFTFALEPAGNDQGSIKASFRHDERRNDHSWSTMMRPSELVGLDVTGFRAAGGRSLRFAVIRDAGRLDCAGQGGSSRARGDCSYTPNAAFARALAAGTSGPADRDDSFAFMALDARLTLLTALKNANFPAPSVDDFIALTALGVTERFIGDLAHAGYRPRDMETLIALKAVGVEPRWVGDMARAGYGGLPSDDLVALKAMGVDANYVRGLQNAGFRHLTADQLVGMKAMGVTAAFASEMRSRMGVTSPERLVELRAVGIPSSRR